MLERRFIFERRGQIALLVLAAGALAFQRLGLDPRDLVPHAGGAQIAREFFGAALRPALTFEGALETSSGTFLGRVALALYRTVIFAAAAMGLAIVFGLGLGFVASSSWWSRERFGGRTVARRLSLRAIAMSVQAATRLFIALLRSVHELIWAVLFLAAFGLNTMSCVLALAIPYAGTLAKVYSEMLDEASDAAPGALRDLGASELLVFLCGRLPRAMPDMAAYTFYRFECAVRSSAVLGFFGYPTLGYYLKLSFENLDYREVWTYLYALFLLVVVFELWSSRLRNRFVA